MGRVRAMLVIGIFLTILAVTHAIEINTAPEWVNNMDGLEILETHSHCENVEEARNGNCPDARVYTLVASSRGESETLEYSISSGPFVVPNKLTGEVFLTQRLDYELNNRVQVTVRVSDEVNTVEHDVHVTIIDVNDEPPTFTKSTYAATVDENSPAGLTIIKDIELEDRDAVNEFITVSCARETFPRPGDIDPCDVFTLVQTVASNKRWKGNLLLNGTVDFERKPAYQVVLSAYDGINRQPQTIEVTISDVQDTPPIFPPSMNAHIYEEISIGSVVINATATDGDKGIPRGIHYSFLQNPTINSYFRINSRNGRITTVKRIDRDEDPTFAQGSVNLIVKAQEIINEQTMQLGNDPLTTATATIRIIVSDVNDNGPVYEKFDFQISIDEDIPNGSPLPQLQMSVSDKDQGINSHFNISLANHKDVFDVEPLGTQAGSSRGSFVRIKDTSKIDFERGPRSYSLLVVASDDRVVARETLTREARAATATVLVTVNDVNDNPPQFRGPYERNISELAPAGTPLIRITATDADSGDFGVRGLVYALRGSGANKFMINNRTGQVSVAPCSGVPGSLQCFDFEGPSKIYNLQFSASDEHGSGLSRDTQLTVRLIDENDNSPIFRGPYRGRIEEGEVMPKPELFVTATDRDSSYNGNNVVRYHLIGNPSNLFKINETTGMVTARRPLVYDPINPRLQYILTVEGLNGIRRSTTDVEITLLDKNDHAPKFRLGSYVSYIPETAPPGYHVVDVKATDNDAGSNADITYSIEVGPEDKFQINPTNGTITVAAGADFNYERTKRYDLIIKATDGGIIPMSSTSNVTVHILDENNKDPRFQPQVVTKQVREDAPRGHPVHRMTATDADTNHQLTYSIDRDGITATDVQGQPVERIDYDYTDLFAIEPSNGLVKVNGALDRDRTKDIRLPVLAIDVRANPRQTGTGTLIVELLDVNNHAPEFIPPWTTGRQYYNISVPEESPNTYFMTMQASDKDGQIDHYEMVQDPDQKFFIERGTGVVTLKSPLDFEVLEKTSFTVRAFDNGEPQRDSVATVYVNIENINDNNPEFDEKSYEVSIPENSPGDTPVVRLTGKDNDKGDFGVVRFSVSDPQSRFTVDPVSGHIRVRRGATLDREATPNGMITVTATISDSPNHPDVRRSNAVPVYIHLSDENDNTPQFIHGEYTQRIIETVPEDTYIFQVSATDRDLGENARVTYRKTSGDPKGLFKVNTTNGDVTTAKKLLNNAGTIKFQIEARDHGNPSLRNITDVTVIVLATNRQPPRWIWPENNNQTVEVIENQYIGAIVTDKVYAVDDDEGENGMVVYGIYYDNKFTSTTPEFSINPLTGVITGRVIFDREKKDTYVLQLVARDRGNPPLQSTQFLTIKILDVDDNPPEFPKFENGSTIPVNFTVQEGQPRHTFVGSVRATDLDFGRYAEIFYVIDGGNVDSSFYINRTTGIIYTNKPLDRETRSIYTLTIRATNDINDYNVINVNNQPVPNPSYIRVTIYVSDINDNGPWFTQKKYFAFVPHRAPFWHTITKITAYDLDGGKITFRISQFNRTEEHHNTIILKELTNILNIGKTNGSVFTTGLMDTFRNNRFDIRIEASDDGTPQLKNTTNLHVWVADETKEIVLLIKRPVIWVQRMIEEYKRLIKKVTGSDVVFIGDIRHHVNTEQELETDWSELTVYVVDKKTNFLYNGTDLSGKIEEAFNGDNKTGFAQLYVAKSAPVVGGGAGAVYSDWLPIAIALGLLAALLLLGLLLLCCCCGWLPCCAGCCGPAAGAKKYAGVAAGSGYGYGAGEGAAFAHDVYENRAFAFDDVDQSAAAAGAVAYVAGASVGGGTSSRQETIHQEHREYSEVQNQSSMQQNAAITAADQDYTIVADVGNREEEYRIEAELVGGNNQAQTAGNQGAIKSYESTTESRRTTSGVQGPHGVTIRTGQNSTKGSEIYGPSSGGGSVYSEEYTRQTSAPIALPSTAGFTIQTQETLKQAPVLPATAGFTIQTSETVKQAQPLPPTNAGFTIKTTETTTALPPPPRQPTLHTGTLTIKKEDIPLPPPEPTMHTGSLTFRAEGLPPPQPQMVQTGSVTITEKETQSVPTQPTVHTGSLTIRPMDSPNSTLQSTQPLRPMMVRTEETSTLRSASPSLHSGSLNRTGTLGSDRYGTLGSNRTGTLGSDRNGTLGSGSTYIDKEGYTVVEP